MYSNDDKKGVYVWTSAYGSDDWSALYPKYVKQLSTFVCPSTLNVVSDPAHLKENATSSSDEHGAHSYEARNWEPVGTFPDGTVITKDRLKTNKIKNSSRVLLITDADDGSPNNNWPDPLNNHGAAGMNVGFCDGHAEWVQTGKPLLEVYMNGHYNPALGTNEATIFARYGLVHSGTTFSWK
jgi:prepilin-type processing-associated H-X9-DG protein